MFKWRHLIALVTVAIGVTLTSSSISFADQLFTTDGTQTRTADLWVDGKVAATMSWETPLYTSEDVGNLDMGSVAL